MAAKSSCLSSDYSSFSRSVIVSGIPEGATLNEIELHFLRSRNGGAGDVESVTWIRSPGFGSLPGLVLIAFSNEDTTARVCSINQCFEFTNKSNNDRVRRTCNLETLPLEHLIGPCSIRFPSTGIEFLQKSFNLRPKDLFNEVETIEISIEKSGDLSLKCGRPEKVIKCLKLYVNAFLSDAKSFGLCSDIFDQDFNETDIGLNVDYERPLSYNMSDSGTDMTHDSIEDNGHYLLASGDKNDILRNKLTENIFHVNLIPFTPSSSDANDDVRKSLSPTSIDQEGDCELSESFNDLSDSDDVRINKSLANSIVDEKMFVRNVCETFTTKRSQTTNSHLTEANSSSSESDNNKNGNLATPVNELLIAAVQMCKPYLRSSSIEHKIDRVGNALENTAYLEQQSEHNLDETMEATTEVFKEVHPLNKISSNFELNREFETDIDFVDREDTEVDSCQSQEEFIIEFIIHKKSDSESSQGVPAVFFCYPREKVSDSINVNSEANLERISSSEPELFSDSNTFLSSDSSFENYEDIISENVEPTIFPDFHAQKLNTFENCQAIEETLNRYSIEGIPKNKNNAANVDRYSSKLVNAAVNQDSASFVSTSSDLTKPPSKYGSGEQSLLMREGDLLEAYYLHYGEDRSEESETESLRKQKSAKIAAIDSKRKSIELNEKFSESFDDADTGFWWEVVTGAYKIYFEFKASQGPRIFSHAFLPLADGAMKAMALIERVFRDGRLFKSAPISGKHCGFRKNSRVVWNGVDCIESLEDARLRNPRKQDAFLDKIVCQLSALLESETGEN